MFARVSTYQVEDDATLTDGFKRATGPLDDVAGFAGAFFLLDSDGRKAMSITLWDDENALEASAEMGNRLRQGAVGGGAGSIGSVENYEVVLTAGRVVAA